MRLLFFAQLRDVTGLCETRWPLNRALTADELWTRLGRVYPDLGRFRGSVRLARNGEYAPPDARFEDADEVALIPPVSGG
jgi:molybdopterin converting factor small subunit